MSLGVLKSIIEMSLDFKNFLEEKPLLTKVSFEDEIKVNEINIELATFWWTPS